MSEPRPRELRAHQDGDRELASYDVRGVGLGGWSCSDHHVYDPQTRTITARRRRVRDGPAAAPGRARRPADHVDDAGRDERHRRAPDGALVVADTRNHRIRRVATDGTATTLAGTGAFGYRPADDGGPATSARLSSPQAVAAFEDGAGQPVVVFADTSANRVRRIAPDGTITTIAGGGTSLGDDGPATAGAALGPARRRRRARRHDLRRRHRPAPRPHDRHRRAHHHRRRHRLRRLRAATAAAPRSRRLRAPQGLAVSTAGDLLIADTGNARVRARRRLDGTIETVAGGAQRARRRRRRARARPTRSWSSRPRSPCGAAARS